MSLSKKTHRTLSGRGLPSKLDSHGFYQPEDSITGLPLTQEPSVDGHDAAKIRSPFITRPVNSPNTSSYNNSDNGSNNDNNNSNDSNSMIQVDAPIVPSTAPLSGSDLRWLLLDVDVVDQSRLDNSSPQSSTSSSAIPPLDPTAFTLSLTMPLYNPPSPVPIQSSYFPQASYAYHEQAESSEFAVYNPHAFSSSPSGTSTVQCAQLEYYPFKSQAMNGALANCNLPAQFASTSPSVSSTSSAAEGSSSPTSVSIPRARSAPRTSGTRTCRPVDSGDAKSARRHPCTYERCTLAFTRLFNLREHLKTHSAVRPERCSHTGCPRAFIRVADRRRHERIHTGETPFVCTYSCGRSFQRMEARNRHYVNDHGSNQSHS